MIYFSSKILKLFIFLFRITRFPRLLLYSFPSERIKKKKEKKIQIPARRKLGVFHDH